MTRTKPRIVVTRKLPDSVEARILRDYDAVLNADDGPLSADRLIELAAGRDGLLVTPTDRLDATLIGRLPEGIGIVATFSVGYEHIDLAAAKARGLKITNTPDVLTDATADMTMLLILAAARRLGEGERMVRSGAWSGWTATQLVGTQVTGKRLGIVGMGRIGCAVARRARAFGMEIHYHSRHRLPAELEGPAAYHPDVDEMLPHAQVLTLHCPLNGATRHFINAEHLARLPDGAILINTARGAVVDDTALIAALKSGKLAAAGLDVYDGEPRVHPGYLGLDNVVLAPHLGSATRETRDAMGFRALDNLDAFFAGREPPDRVA